MPTLRNKPPKRKSHSNHKRNPFYHATEWKRARGQYIQAHPKCEQCGKPGTNVDHIKPMRLGGHKTDKKNLQTLCSRCHSSKSASDGNRYRKEYKWK